LPGPIGTIRAGIDQSRCDQSLSSRISQNVAWPEYPTRVMTPNLKTLTLGGPYKNVHGSFGPQRECVVGELGGSFGGNGSEGSTSSIALRL
jgi:hypothetical protein